MSGPGSGTLYVVATPIGNLEDITLRALRVLRRVDLVACEDTRHTRKLLTHHGIAASTISYHRHNETARTGRILQRLVDGHDVALVSDAGVPGISDPGHVLVAAAVEAGIPVTAIPGPSALTAALSIAGLAADSFLFLGFAPSRRGERHRLLLSLRSQRRLLVFYESPHRLARFLGDCLEIFGNRPACLCKELTKIHEQCRRGRVLDLLEWAESRGGVKGEFVVLIEGDRSEEAPTDGDLDELLLWYRENTRLSMKDCVKKIAADLGLSRSAVYGRALAVWQRDN